MIGALFVINGGRFPFTPHEDGRGLAVALGVPLLVVVALFALVMWLMPVPHLHAHFERCEYKGRSTCLVDGSTAAR